MVSSPNLLDLVMYPNRCIGGYPICLCVSLLCMFTIHQAQSIVPTLTGDVSFSNGIFIPHPPGTHALDLREKLPIRSLSTVHRLDKSTTGCLILTKTETATKSLSRQFSERSIGKTYLALVDTQTNAFQGKSSGLLLTGWTSDDGRPEIVPVNAPAAKRAMTDWKILASSVSCSTRLDLGFWGSTKHLLQDR
jgi:RNA pseudouridylate synthase